MGAPVFARPAGPTIGRMGAPLRRKAGRFATTRWSVVIAAGQQGRDALNTLCAQYWYPLYAFARRRGVSSDEATDLTQGFFARLLEKNDLSAADPARGRFRSWLLASMKHYLANQWAHDHALKRGGPEPAFSLDAVDAERRYLLEPADPMTPETLYEHRWATLLLDRVGNQLREESVRLGNTAWFDRVRGFLATDPEEAPYAELAAELDTTAGALKTRVSRLRKRFRELLRAEVADTVESPDDIDDELRHLAGCLSLGH